MPNLLQIKDLREKYKSNKDVSDKSIKLLTESFNSRPSDIKAYFQQQSVDPKIIQYFENQKSSDVVLLFIDITDFSKKCLKMNAVTLSRYLDDYYDIVIPIIYSHGGEVEKIIGDGIVCLFGEPFLTGAQSTFFQNSESCAKDIIAELKDTDKEVKIALHEGTIMYYKNKTQNYPEYTMIGQPLTELFRLESESQNNAINFYSPTSYDNMHCTSGLNAHPGTNITTAFSSWNKSNPISITLKGVTYSLMKTLTCTSKI
ncbi:adenylate/guanylate cyclase domain-containing protein [Xanthocytophaga agilis]|uniref:Adenylate/guanylate cyclase domain-containing protein n=1 Tax=Xanthocytophaga agilis TaxID=3048010 RepID=A0AAE3R940_9BACT|nr:adenylate/guanylate cyclase domain-containing protein [Xanthocytophaga agilis]MDJ1505520.1 adenylate/guanylate cyclase domain-containing protein [Xanthocytophaga agilis]